VDYLQKAINSESLDINLADKYLKLYVADIDWLPHISSLWGNVQKKNMSQEDKKNFIRQSISSTILSPYLYNTQIPNPPQNLLFWTNSWKQFNDHNWFEILTDIFKEDIKVASSRVNLIKLGVIDPIDLSPLTRQAFNWLYEKALEKNDINENNREELILKFKNIVRAYGGASICSIFSRYGNHVDKVLNWRSGYFFEKEIYKVYNLDQLVKIKKSELSKTNSTYIKKVGVE
jgi:hypothetical protein